MFGIRVFSWLCDILIYVLSSLAAISLRENELVALLYVNASFLISYGQIRTNFEHKIVIIFLPININISFRI